jgi:hypothetical protein
MVAVVVNPGAVIAALVTMDFGNGRLGRIIGSGNSIGCRHFAIGLALRLCDGGTLGTGFVDVSSDLKIVFRLGSWGS